MTFVSTLKSLARALGFHVHTWGKWEIVGAVTSTVHKGVIGRTQIRYCSECGKMDVHRRYMV